LPWLGVYLISIMQIEQRLKMFDLRNKNNSPSSHT
jgi:hypothetical protein